MGFGFKRELLAATGFVAVSLLGHQAHATNVVATIIGAYDAQCTSSCGGIVNGTSITTYNSNGSGAYDTPSLFILNPTSSPFTNVTITLTGYQDYANGGSSTSFNAGPGPAATALLNLPDIAANSVFQLIWDGSSYETSYSGQNGLNLFDDDYDDSLGGTVPGNTVDSLGNTCGSGSGTTTGLCAYVGNFDVKFSATWNSMPIAANFSPDNTQGGGNVAGTFVGWEGLDADGFSETKYDVHSQSFPGTLAVITTGTQGTQPVPEPGSVTLVGAGLAALGAMRRRRKA